MNWLVSGSGHGDTEWGEMCFQEARGQLCEGQMALAEVLKCERVPGLRLTVCLVVEQTERKGLAQGDPAGHRQNQQSSHRDPGAPQH